MLNILILKQGNFDTDRCLFCSTYGRLFLAVNVDITNWCLLRMIHPRFSTPRLIFWQSESVAKLNINVLWLSSSRFLRGSLNSLYRLQRFSIAPTTNFKCHYANLYPPLFGEQVHPESISFSCGFFFNAVINKPKNRTTSTRQNYFDF